MDAAKDVQRKLDADTSDKTNVFIENTCVDGYKASLGCLSFSLLFSINISFTKSERLEIEALLGAVCCNEYVFDEDV